MKKMVIFILIVVTQNYLLAQTAFEQRLRLAETYEKSGDINNAARIYEELYKENSNNQVVFEGLVRNFISLNRYSELLQYVKNRYDKQKDIINSSIYAELLWRTGNTNEANKIWDKAISDYSQNPLVYEQISNSMIQMRLFDKAISVLKQGRNNLNNKVIFSDNLSKLYIAIGDYRNGLTEILSQFQVNWNLAITQGRIYALLINDEAEKYILNELKKFANNNSENIIAQELLAWYYRTTNKLEQALELFRNIDRLKKANGAEILRFAEECRRDGQFDVAMKAYGIVIDLGKNHPLIHSAWYGYARTLEQKIMSQKQMSKESANELIAKYKSIIKEFPNTQQALESRLRIAYILSNYLKNHEEAIKELNAAISERPRTSIAASATIDLANIYINLEKFEDAKIMLSNFINNNASNFQSLTNKAQFLIAEISFFNGQLDTALKQYANLIIVPETDIANASLNRIVLIEQNKQYTKALSSFARAEFEERRNNLKEAIELYSNTANLSSGTDLFELALKKKIEIEYLSEDYQSVIKTADYLLEKVPDSIYGDFALLRKADSLVFINNKQDALNLYTEILSKFPLSIYLPEIREKIKSLRNEPL
ncbi:MAG: hypothetical protein N3A67_02535 [Ignavibacteria bacterium]|nr:hypothetical protein [Ignavibacteria bacterium]